MNSSDITIADDPEFLAKVADADGRIARIDHGGKTYWVKRREELSLRFRLQKGNTERAFNFERAALHRMAEAGAPVPPIVAEGPDFFVTPDCGIPLEIILREQRGTTEERDRIFATAATELAGLHQRGLTHGHPRIKDICWDGEKIWFIDLERYRESLNRPHGHARDVVTFFFSAMAVVEAVPAELEAACQSYRAADNLGIWPRARKLCRRLRFVDWITKPLQMRRAGRSRDFKAISLTVKFFDEH